MHNDHDGRIARRPRDGQLLWELGIVAIAAVSAVALLLVAWA